LNQEIKEMLKKEQNEVTESDPQRGVQKFQKLHRANRRAVYKDLESFTSGHLGRQEQDRRIISNPADTAYQSPHTHRTYSLGKKNSHNNSISVDHNVNLDLLSGNQMKDYSFELKKASVWDPQKENIYQTSKSHSKDLLGNSVPVATFEDCGFSKFIQDILNNGQVKDLREKLLGKYMDGQFLTAGEIKHLDMTSPYLNMFLDKKIFQEAVFLLERECIDDIEMMIGNGIIEEYQMLKGSIKVARKSYLAKKNHMDRRRIFTGVEVKTAENTEFYTGKLHQKRKMMKFTKEQIMRVIQDKISTIEEKIQIVNDGTLHGQSKPFKRLTVKPQLCSHKVHDPKLTSKGDDP
jgi:hypothetical protein